MKAIDMRICSETIEGRKDVHGPSERVGGGRVDELESFLKVAVLVNEDLVQA